MPLLKDQLQRETEQYWRDRQNYDYYINDLLGHELEWAGEHPLPDKTSRLRDLDQPVHALAMTVGESFEPLLQAICVFKPQRLIFVLNTSYGDIPGRDHGNALKFYVQQLAGKTSLPETLRPKAFSDADFDLCVVTRDTPAEVFRILRTAFQLEANRPSAGYVNIVDITGAKKSM